MIHSYKLPDFLKGVIILKNPVPSLSEASHQTEFSDRARVFYKELSRLLENGISRTNNLNMYWIIYQLHHYYVVKFL